MANGSTVSSSALHPTVPVFAFSSPGPKARLFSCVAVLSSQDLSAAAFVICLTSAMFEDGPSRCVLEVLGDLQPVNAEHVPKKPVSPPAANTTARSASAPRRGLGWEAELGEMAVGALRR